MKKSRIIRIFISICMFATLSLGVFAQNNNSNSAASEEEKIPVLVKHLPDWENTRNRATYISNAEDLRKSIGDRSVSDLIILENGVEAATAVYPQGKLLVVEYPTPQASVEADAAFRQRLSEDVSNPLIFYRRIGNYSAFVFDASDEAAANALLDQVKYEKAVQWVGQDPTEEIQAARAEREFAIGTGELFLSTVILIAVGFGSTIVAGIILGLVFFYMREQKRASTQIFTDAGGMTRLNLDGLTPENLNKNLLKD